MPRPKRTGPFNHPQPGRQPRARKPAPPKPGRTVPTETPGWYPPPKPKHKPIGELPEEKRSRLAAGIRKPTPA